MGFKLKNVQAAVATLKANEVKPDTDGTITVKPGKKPKAAPVIASAETIPPDLKLARLRALAVQMNKDMKGVGRVDLGADIKWIDPPRIRTGILGLDVVSTGGLPRGSLVEAWGPYSSGKTTTLMQACAREQERGQNVGLAMPETFNKKWARTNGLWIPHSGEEFDEEEQAVKREGVLNGETHEVRWRRLRSAMEAYNEPRPGWGEAMLIQHAHGDGLLEAVYRFAVSNTLSVILTDSIAVCRNTRQIEEMEVGDEERGGGGQNQMLNRFTNKCMSALNRRYNEKGEQDPQGEIGNTTLIACINQARVKMGGQPKRGGGVDYKPFGGEGLRHAWHLSLYFRRGEAIGEEETVGEHKAYMPHAMEIRVKGDKSKVGPPYRSASWTLQVVEQDGHPAGYVDPAQQARAWGIYYGVIEQNGAWYVLEDGTRCNGKDKLDAILREDVLLRKSIEDRVIDCCRRS
jgi:RecA/RadA recombinase